MSAVYPASDIRFHAMHPGAVNSRFKDKMHGFQHAYMNAIFTLFGDEPAVPARSIQRLIMDDSTGGYWYAGINLLVPNARSTDSEHIGYPVTNHDSCSHGN